MGRGKVTLFTFHFFSLFFSHTAKNFPGARTEHFSLGNSLFKNRYSIFFTKSWTFNPKNLHSCPILLSCGQFFIYGYDLTLQRRAYFTTARSNSAF